MRYRGEDRPEWGAPEHNFAAAWRWAAKIKPLAAKAPATPELGSKSPVV